jgi:hypothetical protein
MSNLKQTAQANNPKKTSAKGYNIEILAEHFRHSPLSMINPKIGVRSIGLIGVSQLGQIEREKSDLNVEEVIFPLMKRIASV